MISALLAAAAGAPAAAAGGAPSPPVPLALESTIPLDGVSGRIDHMAVDLGRGRLLIAGLGNGTVEEVDLATRRVIHRIVDLAEPQGIAYAPGQDLVIVASAGDGSVRFYRGEDLAAAGRIELGEDADNVRLDPHGARAFVGNGSGGLAIIDLPTRKKVGDIPLAAHPEGFQLAADGSRAFINVPEARQIAVADIAAGRQSATWSIDDLRSNFPMAIDATGRLIASVFRRTSQLALIDSDTGGVVQTLDTCGDADDVFFDGARDRLYVSCGAGAVDVFQQRSRKYEPLARIETESGGRTSLFVPELDRLFVAVRGGMLGGSGKILVLRPN